MKWDAGIYPEIAKNGYYQFRCGEDPGLVVHPPGGWCGNSGWFPLYPLLIRALHTVGLPYDVAAVLIAQAALYATFVLLWRLLGAQITATSVLCLGLAVVFPGSLYYHLTYPISLAIVALLACLVALRAGSWAWAGAAGAVGVASYLNTTMLIGLIPLVVLLGWRHRGLGVRAVQGIAGAALAALGAVFVAAVFHFDAGRWDAYFLTQHKYGNGIHNPLATVGHILSHGRLSTPGTATPLVMASLNAPRFQFALVAVIVVIAVGAAAARLARTGWMATLDLALVILTIVLAPVPLVAGPNVAAYRSHALLLPSVLLLRDLPRSILGVLVAACTVAAAMLGAVFYQGILV